MAKHPVELELVIYWLQISHLNMVSHCILDLWTHWPNFLWIMESLFFVMCISEVRLKFTSIRKWYYVKSYWISVLFINLFISSKSYALFWRNLHFHTLWFSSKLKDYDVIMSITTNWKTHLSSYSKGAKIWNLSNRFEIGLKILSKKFQKFVMDKRLVPDLFLILLKNEISQDQKVFRSVNFAGLELLLMFKKL